MFKISGTLTVKNDTQQVSEKFSKRDFVIKDTASMYPQDLLFQLSQDKCSLLDNYQVGQQIEVSFNLRGRGWISPQGEVKYFNTLDAWRIEMVGSVASQPVSQPPVIEQPTTEQDDSGDLPF
jgi:hypothetical protein